MKTNVELYIKKLFGQLSWGQYYKKKTKEILKNKESVTIFSVCLFDAEQHVISSSQRNEKILIGHFVNIGQLLLKIIQN